MSRGSFLSLLGFLVLSSGSVFSNTAVMSASVPGNEAIVADADYADGRYVLPPLPYAYDALEPYIDAETMRLHHDKHHAAYVAGANTALDRLREIGQGKGDAALTTHWVRQLAFHGSGHALHSIFWKNMTPKPKAAPEGGLARAIDESFGSYQSFLKVFKAACIGVEGSGWGVLAYEPMSRKLVVLGLEKHQNLTVSGCVPLLVCDVWEHAYYLKHQNNRAAYVDSFLKVVNWDDVERRYEKALKG